MTESAMKELCEIALTRGSCSESAFKKQRFCWLAKRMLGELAGRMGLKKEDYSLRYNAGGMSVGGDVSLHTDKFYLVMSPDNAELGILYRSCNGRKDYSGGPNRWFPYRKLCESGLDSLREAVSSV